MAVEPLNPDPRPPIPRSGKIRRCSVRHVTIVSAPGGRSTEVLCLLGGRDNPLPLGTMDEARPICAACTATTIWRADED